MRGGETCRRDAHPATSSSSTTTTTRRRRRSREEVHKIYAPPYEMCGAKRVRNSLYSIRGANMECLASVCVFQKNASWRGEDISNITSNITQIYVKQIHARTSKKQRREARFPLLISRSSPYTPFSIYIYTHYVYSAGGRILKSMYININCIYIYILSRAQPIRVLFHGSH